MVIPRIILQVKIWFQNRRARERRDKRQNKTAGNVPSADIPSTTSSNFSLPTTWQQAHSTTDPPAATASQPPTMWPSVIDNPIWQIYCNNWIAFLYIYVKYMLYLTVSRPEVIKPSFCEAGCAQVSQSAISLSTNIFHHSLSVPIWLPLLRLQWSIITYPHQFCHCRALDASNTGQRTGYTTSNPPLTL